MQTAPLWQCKPIADLPADFWQAVSGYCAQSNGYFAAQLLWQRGYRDIETFQGFIDANRYQPTSPFAFGQEMKWAVKRLAQARERGEKVTIWGDFDADGITATSVLWDGLGQFFPQNQQLNYYIPDRLKESHGLNLPQLQRLAEEGTQLIVTCDTGSTNQTEIDQAIAWGMDVIVTDHHTLPEERPPVVAILNPRYFAENHPLYHLSGVAVAYKLVEAMYASFPSVPQDPLSNLLDFVAIGLIADLVQLSGDCRYLAQRGIEQLQQQRQNPSHPGVDLLLKYCQGNGDRPTDISFGIGPRINAISRIHGDARFGVELLTSRDPVRCQQLAQETELANTRRKGLQKTVAEAIKKRVNQLDLSTTGVIVLEDPQWPGGILGLVASKIAQDYGRPTILLSSQPSEGIARGSARSVRGIDLYELLKSQAHLMLGFGGHPFAAGLSIKLENLALFREAINQQFWQQYSEIVDLGPQIEVDLTVTVADLGQELFRELKLLEPCGMGNPVPKLLLQNCRLEKPWSNKKNRKGEPVMYPKLTFNLKDDSSPDGFPGLWWGHEKEEVSAEQVYDVIVELDYNLYGDRYEVRLLDLKPSGVTLPSSSVVSSDSLIDRRLCSPALSSLPADSLVHRLDQGPTHWSEIQQAYHQATEDTAPLVLDYQPLTWQPEQILKQLMQLAKQDPSALSLPAEWGLTPLTQALALELIPQLRAMPKARLKPHAGEANTQTKLKIHHFLNVLREEHFQRQYFCEVPIAILQDRLRQTS